MDKKLKTVIIFYGLVFIIIYGLTFLLFFFEYLSLLIELFISFALALTIFLLIFIIIRYLLDGWNLELLGWKKKNFSKSLLWASASLLPSNLALSIACYVLGTDTVLTWVHTGIQPPYPAWLPLFGIFYWFLSGIISFSFWQAFPYECLKEYPKKYSIPIISILFILLYNQPLMTRAFYLTDIIWLGIIFVLIYHRFQNSLSLVMSYVFLFEGPVVWCFGIIFGELIFFIILNIRAIWCIAAVLILIFKYHKKGQQKNY